MGKSLFSTKSQAFSSRLPVFWNCFHEVHLYRNSLRRSASPLFRPQSPELEHQQA